MSVAIRVATERPTEVASLTLANVISDDTRRVGVEGDGQSPEQSTGVWEATTPKNTVAFPGATAATSLTEFGSGTLTKETAEAAAPFQAQEQWKLVADGVDAQGVDWDGATGNANAHSLALFARVESLSGTCELSFDDGASNVAITATTWTQVRSEGVTPADGARLMRVGFANTATGTLYFQAGQMEEQPISTPVSADSAGATQARSVARVQLPVVGLLDETQGWVAQRVEYPVGSVSFPQNWVWDDGAQSRLFVSHDDGNNRYRFIRGTGGGATNTVTHTHAISAGDVITLVTAWNTTQLRLSTDGSVFTEGGSTNIPTLSATIVDLGQVGGGSAFLDGNILWAAFGSGTLTDADAAWFNRVGVGGGVPDLYEAPGHATAIWDGRAKEFIRRPAGF